MKLLRFSKTNLRIYIDGQTYYHYSIADRETSKESVKIFGVTYYDSRA